MNVVEKKSSSYLGFIQALFLTAYVTLIGLFIGQGGNIFGNDEILFEPILFLALFVASALICALIAFYVPFILWNKKNTKKALSVLLYTALFLTIFTILGMALIIIF